MSAHKFVDVVLDVPTAQLDQAFTYLAGDAAVEIGSQVRVPFGPRIVSGWVVALRDDANGRPSIKAVLAVDADAPISSEALRLARWMQRRYACTLREALSVVKHRGPQARERYVFRLMPSPDAHAGELHAAFGERPFSALAAARALRKARLPLSLSELRRKLARLVAEDVLDRIEARAKQKRRSPGRSVAILLDAGKAKGAASRRLAGVLGDAGGELDLALARSRARASLAAVRSARAAGMLRLETAKTAFSGAGAPVPRSLSPTAEQRGAIEHIDTLLSAGPARVLLAGITGSGKTFVYSRLIDRVRSRGGKAIVLVPEIALTPQTAARFAAVFGDSVGVLHSGLSDAERAQVWRDAEQGQLDVVVGARSAVFAPLPKLALVIVDEEHEASYKQDIAPRYHATEVAFERMARSGGSVVLGSATPSLESFWAAQTNEMTLVKLTQRATAAPLPQVELVDMAGQRGLQRKRTIGSTLAARVETTLAAGHKVLLFVNRRGYAGLVLCRSCGFVPRCRRCAVSLVIHAADRSMRCHICGDAFAVPAACPRCKSSDLLPYGFGTQRVEEEARELFPSAKVVRMDSDSTGARGSHERLLSEFAREGDILIGTQMIAKGLDYPAVRLVGVVAADLDLHRPDFRAAERTFALLTQVSGRAGRAQAGSVVVQTYAPEHDAIALAARHDYEAFAARELPIRRELRYPPFGKLAYLISAGPAEADVKQNAERLARSLRTDGSIEVLGPAPDAIAKARGEHRVRVALKAASDEELASACALAQEHPLVKGVRLTVIVDPR
ncbi:MAG TPA: primosomal protein N' [Candidatus Acidoferrales bacterium]|nr:primosomal protein N' [Candidatus Acidoferrales bacterium]